MSQFLYIAYHCIGERLREKKWNGNSLLSSAKTQKNGLKKVAAAAAAAAAEHEGWKKLKNCNLKKKMHH